MMRRVAQIPRRYLALGALALTLYLPGVWWGAPHATGPDRKLSWGTDDETPLGPLAEVHNIIEPKKDRNLGYPLMYSFSAAAAYAPYMAFMMATGDLQKPSGEYPWGFKDPVRALKTLTIISHGLTALFAMGIVLCVFYAASTIWSQRVGWFSATLMLSCYPLYYYGRTGNVDGPMAFFVSLAFAAYAALLRHGVTVPRALLLGGAIGCALATKESAYSTLLPIPVVLLVSHFQRRPLHVSAKSWHFWRPVAATMGAAIVAFGFGSGLFIEPSRFFAHLEFHRKLGELYASGNGAMTEMAPPTLEGHLQLAGSILSHVADTITWPGIALVALGVGLLLRTKSWLSLGVVLPSLLYLLMMPVHLRMSQLRYMLPAAMGLIMTAGFAWHWGWSQKNIALRAIVGSLGLATLLIGGLRGADITYVMLNDSRYEAGAWLKARLEPGDRIDYFGGTERLPPLPAFVTTERAAPHLSAHKRAPVGPEMQARIRDRWRNNPPTYIVLLPDHSSKGRFHHHTMPPETFDDLESGKLGYERVALFKTPALFPWVRRPRLDFPMVNPPIRIFARQGALGQSRDSVSSPAASP